MINDLLFYLNWYNDSYNKANELLNSIKFNNIFIDERNVSNPILDIKTKYNFIHNDLIKIIELFENVYFKAPSIIKNF